MEDVPMGVDDLDALDTNEECKNYDIDDSEKNESGKEDSTSSKIEKESHSSSLGRIEELEPYVGMSFDSIHHAKEHYNTYARYVGFGIRVKNSRKSQVDNEIAAAQFVCSKQGFKVGVSQVRKKPQAISRVGCLATMRVNRDKSTNKYCVTFFNRDHNHQLVSPTKVHCLRSQRSVSDSARQPVLDTVILDTITAGGTLSQDVSVISKQCGGPGNMGCTEKNLRNAIRTERVRRLSMGDARAATMYLKDQATKNENFFYAIDVDDNDHLQNLLWIDARSRLAYEVFGDVVTFDMTYVKNKCRMPFALFVGVNHHGQSTLFGCALMGDETEESFTWVMETWLGGMHGCCPKAIITDQCLAQKAAIARVFPNTIHRFCLWHIHRKIDAYLGSLNRVHQELISDFENCLYYDGTSNEFGETWEFFLKKYSLRENSWLKSLYRDRHHWSLVFIKGNFFAGMSTTRRSESINSFFDGYVTARTTFYEFVERYNDDVQSRFDKENEADYESRYSEPVLRTKSPLEKHAAQVYTRNIFKKVQVEVFESAGYFSQSVEVGENIYIYKMVNYEVQKEMYKVSLKILDDSLTCQCQLFEFNGFLCRHIFAVLAERHIREIPSKYILHRWTKDANRRHIQIFTQCSFMGSSGVHSVILRFNDIMRYAANYASEASRSSESYHEALHLLEEGVRKIKITNASTVRSIKSSETLIIDEACGVLDPLHANKPVRKPTKRMRPLNEKVKQPKNAKESGRSKTRTCSICSVPGHDMRTCKATSQGDKAN